MKAKIWRYYFGRNIKEIWFAFLSAAFWIIVLQLLDYAEDEWLVVVTLGYICGMVSRFLIGNILLSVIERHSEYAVAVAEEREQELLATQPGLKVVAVVSRTLGLATGLAMAASTLVGLTFILTDTLLTRLQLPSLGTPPMTWAWVAFGISATLYALLLVILFTSAGKASSQENSRSRQRLWGNTIKSSVTGRFAVGI